jgi:AraC-like DNA-binding protein
MGLISSAGGGSMIQNLNKFVFAAFGQILSESSPVRGFPQGQGWTIESVEYHADAVWACRVDGKPTYLDYEQGMTVLAVARRDEAFEYFYLDKPVLLNPGTVFAIIPRGSCVIRRALHSEACWTQLYKLDESILRLNITNQIEIRAIYTFFYQEKEKGFFFKGEVHDLPELVYVDKGVLHNVVDGTDTKLAQGEMMIYGKNLWHMQYADVDTEVSVITISFELSGAPGQLFNRRIPMDAEMVRLLRGMLAEREKNSLYSGDLIVCSLQMLLLRVLQNEKTQPKLKTPTSLYNENAIVNTALSFISANVYQKLSVPFVAQQCNISVSRLTALFQKRLSATPGELIRRTKLEESKILIRGGERNFSEIASLLHYSSVQQLSRQFKSKYGVTPSEFAKSVRPLT